MREVNAKCPELQKGPCRPAAAATSAWGLGNHRLAGPQTLAPERASRMLDIETGRIRLPKVPEPVMAARRGLVEDLLDLGTRFSWKTCLAAALASAVLLQGLAQLLITTTPPAGLAAVGGYAARNLAGMTLRLLGIVVPLAGC